MDRSQREELAIEFANIASEAGRLIMESRESGINVKIKLDQSVVTAADVEAEQLIRRRIAATLPDLPLIAEESFQAGRDIPAPERFILVDPLDGTREFISGSDEFTVNIALIEGNAPILGAIYAPALKQLYLACATAYYAEVHPGAAVPRPAGLNVIETSPVPPAGMRAVGSRSHMDPQTQQWLARFPVAQLRSAGSSLKFCVIARGDADVYPRMAPTMEWDTAAGHAILNAAGGCVVGTDGTPLKYGKTAQGFTNVGFVAWGRTPLH